MRHFEFKRTHGIQKEDEISTFKSSLKHECTSIRRIRMVVFRHFLENVVLKNAAQLEAGAYKVIFKPEYEEGSPYICIYPQMRFSDLNAFKLIKDHKKGLVFISYRCKEPFSLVDTLQREIGAQPLANVAIRYADANELASFLANKKAQLGAAIPIDHEFLTDLEQFANYVAHENYLRNQLLSQSCLPDKPANALYDTLSEIKSILLEIAEFKRQVNSCEKLSDTLPFSAAIFWPLSPQQAKVLIDCASHSFKNFIASGIQNYVIAMKKSMGVALLEYSSFDLMRDLDYLLKRMQHYQSKKDSFYSKYNVMMRNMRDLYNKISIIDKKIQALSSKLSYSAYDLISICELGQMRKDLLLQLRKIYRNVEPLTHKPEELNHLRMIISTMAANLCKIVPEEYTLWESFLSSGHLVNPSFQSKLAKFKAKEKVDLQRLFSEITYFIRYASLEHETIQKMKQDASSSPQKYSGRIKELEKMLASKINSLKHISPLAHFVLSEAYIDSKSHLEYKLGGMMCEDPFYYLNSTDLLLAKFILAPKEERTAVAEQLTKQVAENAKILQLLQKYGLQRQILDSIEPFLYLKEKAFDLESNPFSKLEEGFRGKSIEVFYKTAMEPDGRTSIYYRLGNLVEKVPIPLPAEISASEKIGPEAVYGDKFDLDFLLSTNVQDKSLAEIYTLIYQALPSDFSSFFAIQQSLRSEDLSTSYFLSTFSKSQFSGCISNIGEIAPSFLDKDTNTLINGLRSFYPNYKKEVGELVDFFLDKIRLRIFREINRSTFFWISICARNIQVPSTE
ncbi:MAG: hypothetical protein QXN37_03650 [Candidatus Anstonellaceae archaeon]